MTDRSFPVVEPPFDGDPSTVAASGVVLAAGTSSRFGAENKLLATVDDEPLVRHAVESLLAADLDEVVVVVGYEAKRVQTAVDDLVEAAETPVRIVENEDFATGQASSVRRGVDAVAESAADDSAGRDSADAVLFALGDMPDVRPETVETLVAAFAAGVGDPLVAAYEGARGNPVLFGRDYFDRLTDVEGDTGGREILLDAPGTTLVETGDPGVRRDVDRPGDL